MARLQNLAEAVYPPSAQAIAGVGRPAASYGPSGFVWRTSLSGGVGSRIWVRPNTDDPQPTLERAFLAIDRLTKTW